MFINNIEALNKLKVYMCNSVIHNQIELYGILPISIKDNMYIYNFLDVKKLIEDNIIIGGDIIEQYVVR